MKTPAFLALAALLPTTVGAQINFTSFHTPAQVNAELAALPTRFPGLAHLVTLGNSLEGNPIRAVRISDNAATDEPAEGDVVFVALHHAREWITPEMVLYLAERLLNEYASNPQVKADLDNLQVWVVPTVNPDGYLYTAASSANRLWRKNRRLNADGTRGVDLNRNWGYEWGLDSGSDAAPSGELYRGTAPFSEPETTVLRNFLNSRPNLKAFVTYHSYSELYLRPWSYTTADPPGESTLASIVVRNIALGAAVHGHTYAQEISYTSSGEATDWLWGEKRVAAFTPELRPSVTAPGGFEPAATEIIPNNQENYPAALALIHDAAAREVWIRDYVGDTGAEPSAVWTGTHWTHAFWESPDIWTDPVALTEGTTVTLHVRVHNNSGSAMQNVTVQAFWTDPRISLEFPSLDSHIIGTQVVNVPPGGREITMPWTVPGGVNSWGERHWCVGVVVKHDRDMPLTTQAQRSSNVAIRNFNTAPALAGQTLLVGATNFLDVDAELQVYVDRESLPRGWRVVVDADRDTTRATGMQRRPTAIERKARLLGATGLLLRPGETTLVPVHVEAPAHAAAGDSANVRIQGALIPLVGGTRTVQGNGYTFRVIVGTPDHPPCRCTRP